MMSRREIATVAIGSLASARAWAGIDSTVHGVRIGASGYSVHRIEVAFHGHTDLSDPNQFAGTDSFRKVWAMSPFARINLDIGQFVPRVSIPFRSSWSTNQYSLASHPRRQTGPGYQTGMGHRRYTDPASAAIVTAGANATVADIEYDYGGAQDPLNEVKKCLAYCRAALK